MSNLTSPAAARYYDNSVTITSLNDEQFKVTRKEGFPTLPEFVGGVTRWYNPSMVEIESTSDAFEISLTLENIIFDDAYLHEGTVFNYRQATSTNTYVQEAIVATHSPIATIILGEGAELRNFGGMTAVSANGDGTVIMESGSLITDIGSTAATRQVSTTATDYRANGDTAVHVSGGGTGGFFMYEGAKITNIANAHSVRFNGTNKCFIDGEIANMKGNKGWGATDGNYSATHEGRGFKNAVSFSSYSTTLDPNTGLAGPAIIGPNAYIHDNAVKCGAVAISRSSDASVKIYGKINNNAAQSGSVLVFGFPISAGTNGGGLYVVGGGTIYLEDGCEIKGNSVQSSAYGGAANIQQGGSMLIMNGGTVSGNTASGSATSATAGIVINRGNAGFEMNGGVVDNGPNGVHLNENSGDGTNGKLTLNAGTVSGVTVNSSVPFGYPVQRHLYINDTDVTIGTGYAGVAGRQVKPISADFKIGNPNAANYISAGGIAGALPQGWTMPTTASNVIGFWMQKSGTAVFFVPAPTTGTAPTGYDRILNVYFVAVQGTLANGTLDPSSPVVFLPTTRDAGNNIIINVPLDAYPNGATVALVQPTKNYGIIEFDGPTALTFDPTLTDYSLPYTAEYDMPSGFRDLLTGHGYIFSNTDVTLFIKPDSRTTLDPLTVTLQSDIFEMTGLPVWDPTAGGWVVPLALKVGWDTKTNLTSTFEFVCGMDPIHYQDGGVLTLAGHLVIEGSGYKPYIIYGNQVNTDMTIPTYTITYDGNGADSGNPPIDPNTHVQGNTVTVLGNTGITGDDTDILVRDGFVFLGWSMNSIAIAADYGAGGLFSMPGQDVTLYAIWRADSGGGGSGGGGGGLKYYNITATADSGSLISPSGTIIVPEGDSRTFTFSEKSGYRVTAVYVDGAAISSADLASGKYTFVNVRSNHTISVVSVKELAATETTTPEGGGLDDREVHTEGGLDDREFHKEGGTGKWAVLNLILAMLTVFTGMTAVIAGRNRFRKEEREKRSKTALFFRLSALILGIISVIIFFLTEDWNLPAVFIDKWSLLTFALFLTALIAALASFRFDEDKED